MSDNSAGLFQCARCDRAFAWTPLLANRRIACTCGAAIDVPNEPVFQEAESEIVPEPAPLAMPGFPPPQSFAESLPHAPLGYSPLLSNTYSTLSSGNQSRPGVVIALGIVSILVGLISAVASGVMAGVWRQWAAASTPPKIPVAYRPLLPGDYHLMYDLYIHCVATVAVAICLIGAGIATLVRPAWWTRLLVPYAIVKLVCVAVEISLSLSYFSSVTTSFSNAKQPFDINAGMTGLVSTCIFQSIFPAVILLIFAFSPRLRRVP